MRVEGTSNATHTGRDCLHADMANGDWEEGEWGGQFARAKGP